MAKLYLPCLIVYKGQFICKTSEALIEELKQIHRNQSGQCTRLHNPVFFGCVAQTIITLEFYFIYLFF